MFPPIDIFHFQASSDTSEIEMVGMPETPLPTPPPSPALRSVRFPEETVCPKQGLGSSFWDSNQRRFESDFMSHPKESDLLARSEEEKYPKGPARMKRRVTKDDTNEVEKPKTALAANHGDEKPGLGAFDNPETYGEIDDSNDLPRVPSNSPVSNTQCGILIELIDAMQDMSPFTCLPPWDDSKREEDLGEPVLIDERDLESWCAVDFSSLDHYNEPHVSFTDVWVTTSLI